MGIDVQLQSERGERIEFLFDSIGLQRYLPGIGATQYACLRFIDPYGDTVFNRYQCSVLQEEWGQIMAAGPPEVLEWMQNALSIIKRCNDDVHLFVRFIGD